MEFVRKIDAKFVYVEQVASESAIKLVSSCDVLLEVVGIEEEKTFIFLFGGGGIRWRSEPPIKFLFVSHCSRFTRLDLRSSKMENGKRKHGWGRVTSELWDQPGKEVNAEFSRSRVVRDSSQH